MADEFLKWERPVILGGGSGAMVSRTVFEYAGEFDADLMTLADWDFHYRVCRNTRAAFVAEPLLRYRIHGNNMHSNVQRMEREMTLFYKKAFADPDQRIQKLRRRAMGNFYRILAGSYFQSGQYADFARSSFKSLWNRPSQLGYFMKFPLRRLK